jgi:hypothetical protein
VEDYSRNFKGYQVTSFTSELRGRRDFKLRRKPTKSLLVLFAVLLSLGVLVFPIIAAVPSEPHNADAMWVEPLSITLSPSNASLGYKFNVTVWLNITSANVFGYQVSMLYNRDQLACLRADFTGAGKSDFMTGHSTQTAGPLIDTETTLGNGSVQAFESCKGTDHVVVPRVGSLIWIEFQVVAVPPDGETYTSKFDMTSTVDTGDTWVKDYPDLSAIAVTTYDGSYVFTSGVAPPTMYGLTISATSGGTSDPAPGLYMYQSGASASVKALQAVNYIFVRWELDGVNIGSANPVSVTMDMNHTLHAVFTSVTPLAAKIYVDPPEKRDLTMLPSSTFGVNITIDGVSSLTVCEFNLTYDSQVLSVVGISLIRVQGTYPTPMIILDDDAGFIWMKLTYSAPVTGDHPTPLVTILFHVETLGITVLDLHDTKLIDGQGQPITHEEIDGLFANIMREVAITNVVPSQNWIYQSWPLAVNVTAENRGNVSETFNVNAYYNTSLIGTTTVHDLAPGNAINLAFTWNTTGVPEGNYTIKAEATLVPFETNMTDNTYVDGMVWVMAVIRDVAITNIVPYRNWIYQGRTVKINVTAINNGNIMSETFNVSTYYDGNLIGNLTIIDLPPGNETTLTFDWNTASVTPCHNYTISAQASIVPYEMNMTNNNYIDGKVKVRILGDINGDGKVDGSDLIIAAAAFASYPGHPRWNPIADVTEDLRVDGLDLILISRNYGTNCSP